MIALGIDGLRLAEVTHRPESLAPATLPLRSRFHCALPMLSLRTDQRRVECATVRPREYAQLEAGCQCSET